MSYAPMAMPTGSQLTMTLLSARILLVSWKLEQPEEEGGGEEGQAQSNRRVGVTHSALQGRALPFPPPSTAHTPTPHSLTGQACCLWHKAALKGHVGVLHAAQGDLVVNLGGGEPGAALAHDEGVDLQARRGGG
jgi:hypothetical protein